MLALAMLRGACINDLGLHRRHPLSCHLEMVNSLRSPEPPARTSGSQANASASSPPMTVDTYTQRDAGGRCAPGCQTRKRTASRTLARVSKYSKCIELKWPLGGVGLPKSR